MDHKLLIREALEAFDGKHLDGLKQLAGDISLTAADLSYLFDLIETEGVNDQVGASWLILNGVDHRAVFDEPLAERFVSLVGDDRLPWQVQLHLLQAIESVPIGASRYADLYPPVLILTNHPQKFVRAWAISALIWLADHCPAYRPKVLEIVDAAQGESASVQARIRKRMKRCDWG